MGKEIAVFMRTDGNTASLYEPAQLHVFRRKERVWQSVREREAEIRKAGGLPEMRRQMEELIGFLGECKIVVAEAFQGVPFFELEKSGCHVWEFSGKPAGFLDYILEQEESVEHAVTEENPPDPPLLEEMGEGKFRISIRSIQQGGGGLTSKQVLMPILRRGGFYQLEIICAHVPPWLAGELASEAWEYAAEKVNDQEWRVQVARKVCSPAGA